MQPKKCSLDLYVDFLIASQRQFSGVELSKVSPREMAHDAVSRWLSTTELSPKELWKQASVLIQLKGGYLIIDDSVLDNRTQSRFRSFALSTPENTMRWSWV